MQAEWGLYIVEKGLCKYGRSLLISNPVVPGRVDAWKIFAIRYNCM